MLVEVKGTADLLRRLKRAGPAILAEVADDVVTQANVLGSLAGGDVPAATGTLAQSAFVDGPATNEGRMSVTATVGYAAPHAPYVHEGFHYGLKVKSPPKWLERAANGLKAGFAPAMFQAVKNGLNRLGK